MSAMDEWALLHSMSYSWHMGGQRGKGLVRAYLRSLKEVHNQSTCLLGCRAFGGHLRDLLVATLSYFSSSGWRPARCRCRRQARRLMVCPALCLTLLLHGHAQDAVAAMYLHAACCREACSSEWSDAANACWGACRSRAGVRAHEERGGPFAQPRTGCAAAAPPHPATGADTMCRAALISAFSVT